jgi:hypothetical protein
MQTIFFQGSLEKVVRYFLTEAEKYASEAQSKADQIVLDNIDLDEQETMESIILGSVR